MRRLLYRCVFLLFCSLPLRIHQKGGCIEHESWLVRSGMVQSLGIDLHCEQHHDFGALFASLQPHHLETKNGLSGRLLQCTSDFRAVHE